MLLQVIEFASGVREMIEMTFQKLELPQEPEELCVSFGFIWYPWPARYSAFSLIQSGSRHAMWKTGTSASRKLTGTVLRCCFGGVSVFFKMLIVMRPHGKHINPPVRQKPRIIRFVSTLHVLPIFAGSSPLSA